MNAARSKLSASRFTNALRVLGLAAAIAVSAPARTQGCSGGIDGGTDATGNQCNHPPAAAAVDRSAVAASAGKPARASDANPRPVSAAAHRKQVFDERRARFEDPGHARVAATGAPSRSVP